MKNFLPLLLLLAACVSAFAQPRTQYAFDTLTNLVATDPRSYTEGGNGSVMVFGRTVKHDWGAGKVWTYDRTSSATTNQWVLAPASGTGRLSTVETNDFFPLIAGAAYPITGRMQFASPYGTNHFIQFHYPAYGGHPPVGLSAGLYGSGEHYLRFGSINTNTWNMLNSWFTLDGETGAAVFNGSVTLGGETRTTWPIGMTNFDGAAITSGTINILRMPSALATDAEVAALYGALASDNTWTGAQTFNGPVVFSNLTALNLSITNLTTGTWTNTGNATIVGNLTVGGTNFADVAENQIANRYSFFKSYEFLTPSASRIVAMYPEAVGQSVGSGGSANMTIVGPPLTNHVGVYRLTSGSTASSGYNYLTDPSAFECGGGEEAEFWFRIPYTNQTRITMGWFDSTSSVIPTDGLVLRTAAIAGEWNTIAGYAYSNGSAQGTTSSTNIAENTWYSASISNSIPPGTCTFRLKAEDGTLIWSSTVTSGFPTGNGREFGYGFTAVSTNTVAGTNIFDIDKAEFRIRRKMVR